jgi:hypothetical protein
MGNQPRLEQGEKEAAQAWVEVEKAKTYDKENTNPLKYVHRLYAWRVSNA